jgi:leader peptidase (prepilin peptidase) / N-methyltransferase
MRGSYNEPKALIHYLVSGDGVIIFAIFLGLVFAIGLNGMADNLPSEYVPYKKIKEWLLPRCAYCGTTRKLSDWSSWASWFVRGGGCARCGAPRPQRDFLVETLFPIACLAYASLFPGKPLDLLSEACVLGVYFLITIIDFEHRAVLSEVILMGVVVIGLAGIRNSLTWLLPMMEGALAGLGIALVLYLFGFLLTRMIRWESMTEPLGFGDVMIAGLVGMATGWPGIMMAMFLAVFLGGIVGLLILFRQKLQHKEDTEATMAYGPYLAIAAVVFHYQGSAIAAILLR